MERYEAYKDSGVEWIGEIPADWSVAPLKTLALIVAGQSPANDDVSDFGTLPFLQGKAEFGFLHPHPVHYCDKPKKVANEGSILMSVRAPVGEINIADQAYGIGRGLCAIESKSVGVSFLRYALSVSDSALRAFATGSTFEAVTAGQIGSLPVATPNSGLDFIIANYLDAKTAEIDGLVADCEREVELLREYRKAVISEAVTKGLDPDAPMKDSGVEWIGSIPQGWRVIRVKFLANRLNVGVVINPSTYYDDNGNVPFLKGSNIQGESFDLSDVSMITEESNELLCKTQIHTGDIVMVRVGDPGRSVVVPPELDGANVASMLEVTCGDAVIPEYICRVFNSHLSALQVGLYTYGAAMKQINVSDLAEFYIPIPERIKEQERIIAELNRKTSQIDAFIEAKQSMADKLREYRKSLISEAVTGKFKVPGV